jgi:hypothetical protein
MITIFPKNAIVISDFKYLIASVMPFICELEQEFFLVAAVCNVPDMAAQKMTMSSSSP